jgi:uncharacterized membrane protein YfcA
MWDIALLMTAAFVAGALNAVAGGGSFLTLPAQVCTGVPPVAANATGTVALLPGYMAGAWGFRQDMEPPPGLGMRGVVALSLIGGSLGAALLLVTPDHLFRKVVPWLLLAATAMFAFAPQLRRMASRGSAEHAAHASPLKAGAGMLAVAIYGGYFNGGLGILLLALLTAIAVAIYAAGGVVQWEQALTMMIAATAGGYGGARLARRIPPEWLRAGIVLTGLVMAGVFFWRQ